MNMPVDGLNEFNAATDMQPTTFWPQAARLPRDSSTALPAMAEREKRRRLGSGTWLAGASGLPVVSDLVSLSVKLLTLTPGYTYQKRYLPCIVA